MSQRALLLATRNTLRTALAAPAQNPAIVTLPNEQVEITFDGRPLPFAGMFFVAIWPGSWENAYNEGIEEIYSVNVTVSVRLPYAPQDRWGPEVMVKAADTTGEPTPAGGLDALLEIIRVTVHSSYVLMNAANTIIGAGANGFVEPLRFRNGGRPEVKSGSWFAARGKEVNAGMAQTLAFGDAQRDQTIESMT